MLGKAWEGLLHAHKGSLGLNPHAHLGGVSFYPLEPSGLRSIYYVGLSLLRGQWGGGITGEDAHGSTSGGRCRVAPRSSGVTNHMRGVAFWTPPQASLTLTGCPAGRDKTPSAQTLGRTSSQIKAEAQRGAETIVRSPSPDTTPKRHTQNLSLISGRGSVPLPGAIHQRSKVVLPRSWHCAPSSFPGGAPQTLYRETRAVRGASREMRLGHNSRTPPQSPEPASRGRQPPQAPCLCLSPQGRKEAVGEPEHLRAARCGPDSVAPRSGQAPGLTWTARPSSSC